MCDEANLIFLIKPRFIPMPFELLLISSFLFNLKKMNGIYK